MADESNDRVPRPGVPKKAPGDTPPPGATRPTPERAPGSPGRPDAIEAPPSPTPPSRESDAAHVGVGIGPEEAHVGATEEQVSDLTGPGAGYDQGIDVKT
jgi:hypothetical protein